MLSFSGVTFVLFCFVNTACVLFPFYSFLFFVPLGMLVFASVFCTVTVFSQYRKVRRTFSLPAGVFVHFDHGLDFGQQLM